MGQEGGKNGFRSPVTGGEPDVGGGPPSKESVKGQGILPRSSRARLSKEPKKNKVSLGREQQNYHLLHKNKKVLGERELKRTPRGKKKVLCAEKETT